MSDENNLLERPLQFQAIAAQLELLAWRDEQFSVISLQLEDSLPDLHQELTSQIEKASVFNLVRASLALKSSAKEAIERWGAAPMEIALRRAEAELDQTLQQLPGDIHLDVRTRDQVTKALPAIAGVSLIGASVAAIPAVLTFTTAVPASGVLGFSGIYFDCSFCFSCCGPSACIWRRRYWCCSACRIAVAQVRAGKGTGQTPRPST